MPKYSSHVTKKGKRWKIFKNLQKIYADQKSSENEAKNKKNRICFHFIRTTLMGTDNVKNLILKSSRSKVFYAMTVLKYFATVTDKKIKCGPFLSKLTHRKWN